METEVLFKETQRLRQWWLWLILLFINGLNIWFVIKKYLYKEVFTNTAYHSYAGAEIATLITVLVTVLLLTMKLETIIQTDRIKVRFFPFHLSFKQYLAGTIRAAYIRNYKPILEYGGWGIRFGLFGKGKAFNVSGNHGIQLVFKDESKLLIGTQKPQEAEVALKATE